MDGVDDYSGARKVAVNHITLQHCGLCPLCNDGRLYRQLSPGTVVRVKGQAPLQATVYELEKLRCNICGKIFTADLPVDAGPQKYDESAAAMVSLLRYGSGFPLNRIAKLQDGLGIPLPASTQWEMIEGLANQIHPVYPALIRYGAQADIIHNDDTHMKVQELMVPDEDKPERTGVFTTGILAVRGQRKIALFFTGRKHAGENLAGLLVHRKKLQDPPIQMCDALSRNTSEDFKTLLANCLSHGRRGFVDVAGDFPEECLYVLETIGTVYHHDAIAAQQAMSPSQRLLFHQQKSGPLMKDLHDWLNTQFADKKVEPNSSLGKAIKYMLNHWMKLTLFLREEKAPLDNNICERALKMAILHRKNSLFYKTEHGAYIGDMFMSIIHTCALAKINPFTYLVELQKNSFAVFADPKQWLPWNYQETLALTAN